jgi:hypothetical protein
VELPRKNFGAEVEPTSKNFRAEVKVFFFHASFQRAWFRSAFTVARLILRGASNFVRTACLLCYTRAAGPTGFLSCRAARNYACIRVMTWIEMAFLSTSPYDVEVTCKDSYLTVKSEESEGRSSRINRRCTRSFQCLPPSTQRRIDRSIRSNHIQLRPLDEIGRSW